MCGQVPQTRSTSLCIEGCGILGLQCGHSSCHCMLADCGLRIWPMSGTQSQTFGKQPLTCFKFATACSS